MQDYFLVQALSGKAWYYTDMHPHMRKSVYKCGKSHKQIKLLTTTFYSLIACVWSRYVPILTLLLYRHLSVTIKLKFR